MEIKFTKDQYAQLMRLVYLGNWVVNGYHTDDIDEGSDALEDYIYSKARDFGLEKTTTYEEDQNAWYPKSSIEDEWLADLDEYKNDAFWDELEYRLADRDLVARYGENAVDGMSSEERQDTERQLVDNYYEEFQKNGLKNFVLMRPN
jgi:hypothetical protein